jgi:hypothetical protein
MINKVDPKPKGENRLGWYVMEPDQFHHSLGNLEEQREGMREVSH